MTRSEGNADVLRALGAEPVVCDVYAPDDVIRAVAAFGPDLVMHQLTDSLGEAALNRSLRTLVERFGGPRTPPPTTLDLLGILHADMPARRHAFIDHSLKDAGLLSLPDR